MSDYTYLILANGIVWFGLVGYILFLVLKNMRLKKREYQVAMLGGGDEN